MTYYRWIASKSRVNLRFQKRLEALKAGDAQVDLAEAVVYGHLKLGNLRAAELVLLKTKAGKNRGYGEKSTDLELELILRAVSRIENVVSRKMLKDPTVKPDIKKYIEVAAADFKVKAEDIEREFLKRQPQILEGVQ